MTNHPSDEMLNDPQGQQLVQVIHDRKAAHYFEFSTNWNGSDRLCGACNQPYDRGSHIEITTLKPFTNYVCPTGGGYGHSSVWTGALLPSLRNLHQHLCICGAEFVEVDNEKWKLTWEMVDPFTGTWTKVKVVKSRHEANAQHAGLQGLMASSEQIRNIKLKRKGKK